MAHPRTYGVLAGPVEHEIEVKRSRFLAVLARVEHEDAARAHIAEVRAAHRLARHHCTAYVLGPQRRVQRANDDGEPSGTAGAPMLDALTGFVRPGAAAADLSDVVAVVVRYFGGVLLGAGGLTRAYSDAVATALASASFVTRAQQARFALEAPVAAAGRWENELRATGVGVLEVAYTAPAAADDNAAPTSEPEPRALLTLAVADTEDARAELATRVAALSAGTAMLRPLGVAWVDAA